MTPIRSPSAIPNLKPVTGNNFDLDIEYYLNDSGILEFGAFDKEFQNYIFSRELIVASDPRLSKWAARCIWISYGNLGASYARGLEAAYQQKFTFLPKPLDGLGFEGNVSYVTSNGVLRTGEEGHSLPGILSFKAFNNNRPCCGVITIRAKTFAFGTPGNIRVKSMTNSAGEWVMIAKFE